MPQLSLRTVTSNQFSPSFLCVGSRDQTQVIKPRVFAQNYFTVLTTVSRSCLRVFRKDSFPKVPYSNIMKMELSKVTYSDQFLLSSFLLAPGSQNAKIIK